MKPFPYLLERSPHLGGAPWRIMVDMERTCHAILCGASNSGKSRAAALYASKAKLYNPAMSLWILDFKGDDLFAYLRGRENTRYFQYADCMAGLEDYYTQFQVRLSGDRERRLLLIWVDELGSFILNQSRTDAERIRTMMATILMMGRSLGCMVLVSVQRASAELFAQGSRDNYGLCLGMGNLSKESAATLGFERETMLPVTRIGGGTLLENGTNQRPVQVPLVDGSGLERMKETLLHAVID